MAVHFTRERMEAVLDSYEAFHNTPFFRIGYHADDRKEAERILALR